MNQKLLSKVLATILVVTLTFTNFILLGVYATDSYATDASLENQGTVTNNENVEFDAYFKDEKGNNVHQAQYDFDEENQKLYLSVQVKTGYLKDAKVQITGENNTLSNFKIVSSNETLEMIEKIDSQNNEITLKQLNSGTQVILQIPIKALMQEEYDLSNFSKINDIKLTGSYVGNNGKTVNITKTIQTRNEWTNQAVATLEQELTKFIPYEIGENKGTLIQTVVKTGLENNALPVEETILQITVPTINGEKPNTVWVTANSTKATNGKGSSDFTNEQWSYNQETGIITITVQNKSNNNKVSWVKDVKDEYVIEYNYSTKLASVDTIQETSLGITAYNNTQTHVTKDSTLEIKGQEKIGNIVTANIYATEKISKGPLYTKTSKAAEYIENVEVEISNTNLVDKIVVVQNEDKFVDENLIENATTVNNKKHTYFKTTKISKANFDKILGNQGFISIYAQDGQQLVTLNENTPVDENGDLVYTYSEEINYIKIITSKPIAGGKLQIENTKNLKGQDVYTKAQILKFENLEAQIQVDAYKQNQELNEETNISTVTAKTQIEMVNPFTEIEVSTNTNTLSSTAVNKNVELRVILRTNDVACDLYKNPKVQIQLPSFIEKIDINDIKLLFDEELQLENHEVTTSSEGIVITANIKGEDTVYNKDEITKGANLVINADITLKQLTPTLEDRIKVMVENENATQYTDGEDIIDAYKEITIKSVAPTGIITTNTIRGYNTNREEVTSVNGKELIGKLETKTQAKIANVEMQIVNNYSNKLNNVVVLGRIPTKGNKNPETLEDLGSNLETILESQIYPSNPQINTTIYYSTNIDATKDLSDANNKWTTTISDFSNIKSYLIVFNNEIGQAQSIKFNYNIVVPENLEHNLSAFTTYTIYFNNVKETETTYEKVTATKVGISTGEGANLNVSVQTDKTVVDEGTELTYNILIKNIGQVEAKNIVVNGKVTQNNWPTTLEEKVVSSIPAGETVTVTYKVKAKAIRNQDGNETMDMTATIKADNLEKEIQTETSSTKVNPGYITYELTIGNVLAEGYMMEKQEITYLLTINNVNGIAKQNLVVTDVLPKGITFVSSENGTYNETTRTVTWNLGTLEAFERKTVILNVTIDKLEEGKIETTITNQMTIKSDDKESQTNEVSIKVGKPRLEIQQTSKTQSPVEEGDIITYDIVIKNTGLSEASQIDIIDVVPEGLTFEEAQYSSNGETSTSQIGDNQAQIIYPALEANQTLDVTIKMKANDLEKDQTSKEVKNKVTVSCAELETITSNEVTHKIVPKTTATDDPSTDIVQKDTYEISGAVWLDENQNGKIDEGEQYLPEIKVTLIDAENGKIVTDITTGKRKEQKTNENGAYLFSNLKPGKYMVIFEFDTNTYGVTIYKEEGVNDNLNSDVILVNANISGEDKKAAATDKITLGTENIENIDMGLVINPQFDLSLDKVITKITTQTSSKTKTYEYKDSKLAKLDLPAKTVNDTTIIVEYKIRVTNQGAIAGYAKKVIDYIPQGMKFSSDLNKDWYQSTNGNLYNSSLANTLILPGETKELTLLLTKKVDENNLGIINNTAEIYESYNDLGLSDIDSTPANGVQKEDDISSADAMLSIKTGEVYMYITLTIVCIGIFGVGIFFIKKKVLRKI